MNTHEEHSIIEYVLSLIGGSEKTEKRDSKFYEAAFSVKEFIDELPGGLLIYKADGDEEILYANKALINMFGCDNFAQFQELTGNSFKGLVYSEDLEEVEKSIKEQISNSHDDLDYVEYRIMRKDGVLRWVEDYGHYVRTRSHGNFFYVFISEATEKINRRNQEHLQRLEVIEGLSINYDSILYADLKSDTVLPYRMSLRLDKQFASKMQVREYSWFIGDYVERWVHPEDRNTVAEKLSPSYIKNKLKDTKTYYINFRCVQDGEIKYLQLRIVNVGSGAEVSQIVLGYRNIDTEVLQEMKQKQLLEEALNTANLAYVAKNTFLSNMSHDMRTPLNAIFGYAALARKNVKDEEQVLKHLGRIEAAGKQILDLVEKVLEISYIESQEYHISETECNLFDIVQGVHNGVSAQATAKNVSISLHASAVEHRDVYADKEKLGQVLLHVVGNAVKYTDNGGSVDVTVTEQQSSSQEFATYRFIIKDTGIGIAEDALERIFKPFEREKNTTHSGVYGSGLGLTIAKHIIEMMGGSIEAQSAVGKGSTFTITVSLRLQTNLEFSSADEENFITEISDKKILLVEDNEINLDIETEMLTDIGLVVDTAENGKIAVDKMSKAKPGEYLFVLMDIQMPVMDGRQAAEAIRKLPDPAVASTPIIALSANAFESDKRASLEAGMNEHLTKPIDIPLLLKTLAKILDERK